MSKPLWPVRRAIGFALSGKADDEAATDIMWIAEEALADAQDGLDPDGAAARANMIRRREIALRIPRLILAAATAGELRLFGFDPTGSDTRSLRALKPTELARCELEQGASMPENGSFDRHAYDLVRPRKDIDAYEIFVDGKRMRRKSQIIVCETAIAHDIHVQADRKALTRLKAVCRAADKAVRDSEASGDLSLPMDSATPYQGPNADLWLAARPHIPSANKALGVAQAERRRRMAVPKNDAIRAAFREQCRGKIKKNSNLLSTDRLYPILTAA